MPSPHAPAVSLLPAQRAILQQIASRSTGAHRLVQRARMILWMDQGRSNERIARDLQLNRGTVRYWRARWLELMPTLEALPAEALSAEALSAPDQSADKTVARQVESALQDEPRCGAPLRFSAEAVVGIVALACEDPQNSGRPVSHWSAREIADEAQKRGLVDSISPRTVERFLKAVGSSSPQS